MMHTLVQNMHFKIPEEIELLETDYRFFFLFLTFVAFRFQIYTRSSVPVFIANVSWEWADDEILPVQHIWYHTWNVDSIKPIFQDNLKMQCTQTHPKN